MYLDSLSRLITFHAWIRDFCNSIVATFHAWISDFRNSIIAIFLIVKINAKLSRIFILFNENRSVCKRKMLVFLSTLDSILAKRYRSLIIHIIFFWRMKSIPNPNGLHTNTKVYLLRDRLICFFSKFLLSV